MANQTAHILIVDDHPHNLKILSTMLAKQGYKVFEANCGKVALEKVKSAEPDLILLDINMPDMSGYEVCTLLKQQENTKDIPVIFVSALDSALDKLEAFSVGGVDYINKPFDLVEVLARVDTHIKLHSLQQQMKKKTQALETQNIILQNEVCDRFGFDHEFYKELEGATEREELQLYYQPIVDFETRKILGFEALLRWLHPIRGMIPPLDFIPLAETTGLINPIGEWIIREAVEQLSLWQQLFPTKSNLAVSVNVSGNQLLDNCLFDHTKKVLEENGVAPHKLRLEITESILMNDPDATVEILEKFKMLGLQLYIDDFGTGYSSLSRLYDFPVDVLKIDKSFLQKENWIIVKAITKLAAALDKEVIVEGVETIEQLNILQSIFCHQGQGYYFSKPVDAFKATEMIDNN